MESHEHGWRFSFSDEAFKCDYEDDDGTQCEASISLDKVTRLISSMPSDYLDGLLDKREEIE